MIEHIGHRNLFKLYRKVNQFIITMPAVTVDNALGIHFPLYNTLQGLFSSIRDSLGILLCLHA